MKDIASRNDLLLRKEEIIPLFSSCLFEIWYLISHFLKGQKSDADFPLKKN